MTKFIELHSSYYGTPLYINVDAIAYIEEYHEGTQVFLHTIKIGSHERQGVMDKVESKIDSFFVIESYSKVKSLIDE